jgi:hypothetical protein
MKKINLMLLAVLLSAKIFSQTISTFENLSLPVDSFWDGADLTGGFASGNAFFNNNYDTSFHAWSGFVYSNMKDSTTAGYSNQYSAVTASGFNGSNNYAVADEYGNAKIRLTGNASGKIVRGFYVTNTTYAYLSMKNGDSFAKKFGGATGADPDWFRLRVLGWYNGALKQQAIDFFLADFRFTDSTQDYILHDWNWLDLQPLGEVDSLLFNLSSSDTAFGFMNTPAYFAMDNFTTADVVNTAPIATDDAITVTYLTDTLVNVLSNDFDTSATPLTIMLIGQPLVSGAADSVINNSIYYKPAIGIVATDTLWYKVCDDAGLCDTAQLVVTVTGITDDNELNVGTNINMLYPNPFNSEIVFQSLSANSTEVEILVFDATGKNIFKTNSATQKIVLETSLWNSGIYFVKISSGSNVVFRKVVKQ